MKFQIYVMRLWRLIVMNKFKTAAKREQLLKDYFNPEYETEEKFWKNMPEIMWEIEFGELTKIDLVWGNKVFNERGY